VYLKSIELHNTGPIESLKLELPFNGDFPEPLVLVGRNGSGKSTVLSFIVNAILAFKQRLFDEGETETGRVYRVRSPLGVRHGANYFYAGLTFEQNVRCGEWQLDRPRIDFESQLGWTPAKESWNNIGPYDLSHFNLLPGGLITEQDTEKAYKSNCLLFFPADRFEPPDWLNVEDLSSDLHLPEQRLTKRRTERRVISRNRLKPTIDWLISVGFDMLLQEEVPDEHNANVFQAVGRILREVLTEQDGDDVRFSFGNRHYRLASVEIIRNGMSIAVKKDLLGLSAGESALFCLFASIIRDADQAQMSFRALDEIRGIVLIDEADLHLHLGLQHGVLPRLIALFPRVQFIITVHAPLVVLGMESVFGNDGFTLLEMPSGNKIEPERYSEFLSAFDVLSQTRKFQDAILTQATAQPKPVLLLEGKTDAQLIAIAWRKLHPLADIPFNPIGVAVTGGGGAKTLGAALRYWSGVFDKTVVAVFDNDREGAPQFAGLKAPEFISGNDVDHKRHSQWDVHATLLPIPQHRTQFVPSDSVHRLLEIEHYFNDSLLTAHGMQGDPVYPGTFVFEISGDKKAFAEKAADFDVKEFAHFESLFNRIQPLLDSGQRGEQGISPING